MFFKHFASKNQLPGFSVTGTLAVNGLTYSRSLDQEMACFSVLFFIQSDIFYVICDLLLQLFREGINMLFN